ncbi:flagellar hook assembly protein FlgD [Elioraea sp.]|uniref:flagellar hook assembly protein FlgD n=1 Tax=Elioraea sp. TaxID=2185103 RepID=UPI003F72B5A7
MTDVSATTLTAAQRQQSALASRNQIASNFQDFLKLLTTQLQHQDPTAPLDTNQFTQQLVQFAQVEQQLATNSHLERLINVQETTQLTALTPLIGRTVEADSNKVALQWGEARGAYSLRADATSVTITIRDATGRVVAQGPGETRAGRQEFAWDGVTGNGQRWPDGAYTVTVQAQYGGSLETVPTTVIGRITGAERSGGGLMLSMGTLQIDTAAIRAVTPDR